MTTPADLESVLRLVHEAGQRRVPCPQQAIPIWDVLADFSDRCICGGGNETGHLAVADPSMEWAKVLTLGRAAQEGEVCDCPCHRLLSSGWKHTDGECPCGQTGELLTGHIGGSAGISGLLVPCPQPRHWIRNRCAACGCLWANPHDDHGETQEPHGLVLAPLLRQAIEAGEWGMAVGCVEDRLRESGVYGQYEANNDGSWRCKLRRLSGETLSPGHGDTPFNACVDALRRAVEP